MFKKGQLVRVGALRHFYLVDQNQGQGSAYVSVRLPSGFFGNILMEAIHLQLIGNNYQPKPQHGDGGEW